MKISRIITSGLASGALRMRPEVMGVIKKLSDPDNHDTSEPPREPNSPEPPAPEEPPPALPPPSRSEHRTVSVSPWPVRWLRWSCLMLGCAALGLRQPASAAEHGILDPSPCSVAATPFPSPPLEERDIRTLAGHQGWISRNALSPVVPTTH